MQSGHILGILTVHFSPKGLLAATGSADESVRLWDLRIGCELRAFTGHRGPVYGVRFSPDGRWIASASYDRTVRVWDVETGEAVHTFSDFQHPVQMIRFSLQGTSLIAFSDYFGVRLRGWELPSGQPTWSVDFACDKAPNRAAFAMSDDGSLLATFGERAGTVMLRQLPGTASPRELAEIKISADERIALEFSSNAQALVVASDGLPVRLIPVPGVSDGATLQSLPGEPRFYWLDKQPDGAVVGFGTESVELWDVEHRRMLKRIGIPADALSADARLAAQTFDRRLAIFDTTSKKVIFELGSRLNIKEPIGNLRRVFSLAANPVYPTVASAGPDGFVRLWDLRTGRGPTIFQAHESFVEALAFGRRGTMLATGGTDHSIKFWSASSGASLGSVEYAGVVEHLAFSPDGRYLIAIGSEDKANRLRVIDIPERTSAAVDLDPLGEPSNGVFSPGGLFLVADHKGLLEFSMSGLQSKLIMEAQNIVALAMSCTGQIAVVGSLRKWREGLMAAQRSEVETDVGSVVLLFDPRTQERRTLPGKSRYVRSAAFSPDGTHLAIACGDGTINLWDISQGDVPHVWQAHVGDVTQIAYTSDGRFLVSIGLDSAVRFWDPTTRQLRLMMISLTGSDYVAVTASGTYTATRGGLQGVVFRLGTRAVPFDQFDVTLNRPDEVLRELGYAYDDILDAYHSAYERRLKRMNLGAGCGAVPADLEVPSIALTSDSPPVATTERLLSVTVKVDAVHNPLERIMLYANEVPLPNRAGTSLPGETLTNELSLKIPLAAGENLIQVSAINRAGTESVRESFRVAYVGEAERPTLYVLAVGVSEYERQELNLHYAAKDAEDLVTTIGQRQKHFRDVRSLPLVNGDACRKRILDARAFLEESTVDDQVIMLFAGHGVLYEGDYWFVPHDFNPENICETAVTYGDIEALLDGIPTRRRLVLIDTCHAGEAEGLVPSESENRRAYQATQVTAFRNVQLVSSQPVGEARPAGVSDLLLTESFADLRRRAGAFVIGAAGAAEYALEQESLRNGVFTGCVLDALRGSGRSADLWADDVLRVSELHRYVSEEVPRLTGGRQRPISRAEILVDDFAVI